MEHRTTIILASVPGLSRFELPFAFTIIHEIGRPTKIKTGLPLPCIIRVWYADMTRSIADYQSGRSGIYGTQLMHSELPLNMAPSCLPFPLATTDIGVGT